MRSPSTLNQVGPMVAAARERIAPFVQRTPLLRATWLDGPHSEVWIKLECWQKTGSFKARGAYNALLQLPAECEIFTGSAGNHGLAIAAAAAELGRFCQIVVPESASDLKLRRIHRMGARIVPVGRDLFESTVHARSLACLAQGRFVSAFGDWNVVAGQGTCAAECFEDLPEVSCIVTPLGGGGLAVGVAGAISAMRPSVRLFAAHPAVFGRQFAPGRVCQDLRAPVVPSIADGLGVQVDDDGEVASHVESAVTGICCVSEDDIKIAVTAMLHLEGILLEGAGAIGIAAVMSSDTLKRLRGTIVVLATGRNVSSSDVGHALGAPVRDPYVRELLGLRHAQPALQFATAPSVVRRSSGGHCNGVKPRGVALDWRAMLQSLDHDIERLRCELQRHRNYAGSRGLRQDPLCVDAMNSQLELCMETAHEFTHTSGSTWAVRARYRLLLQIIGHIQTCLQWASSSQDQSIENCFFDPAEQASSSLNYARYGTLSLRAFELRMRETLGFDPSTQELLATSSGMAAYQVLETFLLRNALLPDDTIAYAPYIYFEGQEQMLRLPGFRHVTLSSYGVEQILREVAREDPRVVFLDPVANCPGMPTIDLRNLANSTRDGSWKNRWLVIDGTMVSGGLNPFAWFNGPDHPRILYYESGSKYLQLGMDLQMAGMCVFNVDLYQEMYTNRRNSGTTMYSSQIACFPRYNRDTLLARMKLLSRNAGQIASTLQGESDRAGGIVVGFPSAAEQLGWQHAGGVVTLEFADFDHNSRACLERYIEMLLAECRSRNVALTRGVSFGFGVTRVSAASAMAKNADPFLRFSAGEETREEMETLCSCVEAVTLAFVACEAI